VNLAPQNKRVNDDRAWRRLTVFKNVEQLQTPFLRIEECQRLIGAAMPTFDHWSQGCQFAALRLGELLALTVAHVGESHVTVRHSKTGKIAPRTAECRVRRVLQRIGQGPDNPTTLRPADVGKAEGLRKMLKVAI
jgi:hypothetical protein